MMIVIGLAGVVFSALGYVAGRFRAWQEARREMQFALERSARDVRAFARNRWGSVPGSQVAKALREAEEILWWRSRDANYLAKPTGVSRMRPPDEPRSETKRRERQRNQIWALAGAEDTGQLDKKELMQRRYSN